MRQRVMLDLFCGQLGWSKAFLARGWKVIAVDLVDPPEIPAGVEFRKQDVMDLAPWDLGCDFICASSPCEEFSVHGMKHFHPNPKYPHNGIMLFNYTRQLCEASGRPYVMENVRPARKFVGDPVTTCGSFSLWGTGVPPLMPQGISKTKWKMHTNGKPGNWCPEYYIDKKVRAAKLATIPPELANCVADYAERLLEQREARCQTRN